MSLIQTPIALCIEHDAEEYYISKLRRLGDRTQIIVSIYDRKIQIKGNHNNVEVMEKYGYRYCVRPALLGMMMSRELAVFKACQPGGRLPGVR